MPEILVLVKQFCIKHPTENINSLCLFPLLIQRTIFKCIVQLGIDVCHKEANTTIFCFHNSI